MWNEAPLRAMRRQLQCLLPERAFLRRDRGGCALITNAPAFDSGLSSVPGFICFREGALMRLLPDESWIESCELADPPDFLSRSLLRFRGMKPDMENLKLFAEGAKLLDMGGSAPAVEADTYDKKLRRQAALALRGGCGGGLYACSLLNAQIQTNIKGEKQL